MDTLSSYKFIRLPQLIFSSCCLVLMLPFFVTLCRTETMHVNCKCVLMISVTAKCAVILNNIVFVGLEYYTDIEDPQRFEDWRHTLVGLAFSYTLASGCTLWLLAERFAAMKMSAMYSMQKRPQIIPSICFLTSTILGASAYTYYAILSDYLVYGIVVMQAVEASQFVISIWSFYKSRSLYRKTLGMVPLSKRYQISEVVDFNRSMIPILILSSILKSLALWPALMYILEDLPYVLARGSFCTIHALNTVLFNGLLFSHKGLNRTFRSLPFVARLLRMRSRAFQYNGVADKESAVSTVTATHFELLRRAWT